MPRTASLTPRMISDFCRLRLAKVLEADEREAITQYLVDLLELMAFPPYRGKWVEWADVSVASGIDKDRPIAAKHQLQPVFDAVSRAVAMREVTASPTRRAAGANKEPETPKEARGKKRGPKPRPIVEFPQPLWEEWDDPATVSEALVLQMRRHGDSVRHLFLALDSAGKAQDQRTLMKWCTGQLLPRTVQSFAVLAAIEHRYRLAEGYFKSKLPNGTRATYGHRLEGIPAAERRRPAWHLPDDFLSRSKAEQEEILTWVRRVIISGSTDYRRYQAEAMKQRYAVRFTAFRGRLRKPTLAANDQDDGELDAELESAVVDAPAVLDREMNELLRVDFRREVTLAFH